VNGDESRPRLTVFRSAKHIYAQVIDDTTGQTLAHASTLSKDLKGTLDSGTKVDAAKKVGALIAQICKSKKIDRVVFDRNGYLYHGRVSALAQAAREAGLEAAARWAVDFEDASQGAWALVGSPRIGAR
jgi:large subunit ribosomal protein L18